MMDILTWVGVANDGVAEAQAAEGEELTEVCLMLYAITVILTFHRRERTSIENESLDWEGT